MCAFNLQPSARNPHEEERAMQEVDKGTSLPESENATELSHTICMYPEDERNARIIKNRTNSAMVKLVVRGNATVAAITTGLMTKWAADLNFAFQNAGNAFAVQRFDVVVLGTSGNVVLAPELTVEELAPLIVSQADDEQVEANHQLCRLYYRCSPISATANWGLLLRLDLTALHMAA